MYHIRRERDGEERSLHQDDARGLAAASAEARMRAQYTLETYVIYDDVLEEVVHVVEPILDPPVGAPIIRQPAKRRYSANGIESFLGSAVIVAMILWALIHRRG